MEDDHVFKVPLAKKKPRSLYCKESLDGLDDLWQRPKQKPAYGTEQPMNDPNQRSIEQARSYTCDPFLASGSGSDYHSGEYSFSDSKYALGLLNEFRESASCSYPSSSTSSTMGSSPAQVPGSTDSCPGKFSRGYEKVQPGFGGNTSSDDEDMSMSPDVLILRDESMANADYDSSGSDVDWDSLTPPAPRSPGDHTVPDMYDLDSITPPSDCLMSSYDYLASVQHTLLHREQAAADFRQVPMMLGNAQRLPRVPSSADHTVPNFYV